MRNVCILSMEDVLALYKEYVIPFRGEDSKVVKGLDGKSFIEKVGLDTNQDIEMMRDFVNGG